MMKLIALFALFAIANAGCKEVCTKSATDADFVKGYIAKAEAAAENLAGKIEAIDEAKAKQGAASATAGSASLKASASKQSYDNSGLLGFFKEDETVKIQDQKNLIVAKGAFDSAKTATADANAAKGDAETGMAKANKSIRGAAKFAISSCVNACKAARDAAKKVYETNPSNKFGVSAGLSIAAAGKKAGREPAKCARESLMYAAEQRIGQHATCLS